MKKSVNQVRAALFSKPVSRAQRGQTALPAGPLPETLLRVPKKMKKPARRGMFRDGSMGHKITAMVAKLTLMSLIFLGGCAIIEFDAATTAGPVVRVGNSQDVSLTGKTMQYRLRADEGHLVFWIENPTDAPVDLLGKSEAVDPEGIGHELKGQTIEAGAAAKEIFPPMMDEDGGPAAAPTPVGPYDRPGFIPVPGSDLGGQQNSPYWQWDDGAEIQLNLFFEQGGHSFEDHFFIRRVRE